MIFGDGIADLLSCGILVGLQCQKVCFAHIHILKAHFFIFVHLHVVVKLAGVGIFAALRNPAQGAAALLNADGAQIIQRRLWAGIFPNPGKNGGHGAVESIPKAHGIGRQDRC